MGRPAQIAWVLCKTAIFTALAPFTVGLLFPRYVHWSFTPASDVIHPPAWSSFSGLGILLAGVVLYLWCAWDFAVKGMGTPAPIDAPKKLVVNGPYRFVRNPMYCGVFLLILSQATLLYSRPILVYLVFVFLCFHLFIVLYEEPHLGKTFGAQYHEYRRKVRRWIPRFPGYRPPAT
jgi:protein-S-isoprenylcysteine O-methyltransferase Ste14